ncbi:MAG: hypothetical protein ACRDD1_01565, partial [Planctomycetia bacterium]
MKGLAPLLTAICLAAAALLLLDHSPGASGRTPRVRLIEYAQNPDVETARQGVVDGLEAQGLVSGRDYRLRVFNAA